MNFLALHYGDTWYGKEAKKELAAGAIGKHATGPPVASNDGQGTSPAAGPPIVDAH
jgi:hypothetical protein